MTQSRAILPATKSGDARGPEVHETELIASESRSIAEWTTLGISVSIVLIFLGVITWLQVTSNGMPAIISVEQKIEHIRHDETGYYLPVTVRNDGAQTIEDVRIQASLTTPDGTTETREFPIDFLVRDEITGGTFVFNHDPTDGDLVVNAASYRVP
ncbi:MAG TPA: hypothetical protein VNZ58_11470 [Thermomicrobiales bacterium]|nr:hypothetical protein [Thermomicrobiales bacterium]